MTGLLKIIHRQCELKKIQRTMAGERCVYRCGNCYCGWTGFEEFGVISPYRYFGWAVTCNILVMVEAYGSGRRVRYFDRVEQAAEELRRLMGVARNIGQLSRIPVEYFDPEAAGWPPAPLPVLCGLEMIRDNMRMESRSPNSPARWRRWHQNRERGTWSDEDLADELENVSA